MKTLLKVKSTDVVLKLNFNYDNLYARIRAALKSDAEVFTKMNFLGPNISWSVIDETRRYKSLDSADSEEKTVVVAKLKSLQQTVKSKLSSQKDLAPYTDVLFEVPDESFIFFSDDADHRIVLAGWGCRMAHTANNQSGVLAMLIGNNNPVPQQQVVVKAVNQFGNPVSDRLAFDLDSNHQEFTVGADGTKNFGALPIGKHFHITDLDTDFKKEFLITEGLSTYLFQIELFEKGNKDLRDINRNVREQVQEIRQEGIRQEEIKKGDRTFEFMGKKDAPEQDVEIKVLSATSSPIAGHRLRIDCLQNSGVFYSDNDGIVPVGKVPVGTEIKVKVGSSDEERTIHVESGKSTYSIICSSIRSSAPVVSLLDSSDVLVFDADIKVIKSGQETIYNSGSEGMVVLPSMKEGEHFIVVDKKCPNNSKEFVVSPDQPDGIYPFHLQIQGNGDVRVIVYDQKNRPVKNCSVALSLSDGDVVELTGTDGAAVFKRHNFKSESDIPVKCTVHDGKVTCGTIHYSPDKSDYPIGISTKEPVKFPIWILGVLGALLALFGGYEIYKNIISRQKIEEMKSGVGLIIASHRYYVDLQLKDITIGDHPLVAYFNYDENTGAIENLTFDPEEAKWQICFGTGFLISEDGLIATNRHVAKPLPPDNIERLLKAHFQEQKNNQQKEADDLSDELNYIALDKRKYLRMKDCQEQIRILDAIINTGRYDKVEVECQCFIAFSGSRVENFGDFSACSQPLAYGEPGGVCEKDLAIVQIKKQQDLPKDAYVFNVPERDLMDDDIRDNYEVTVIGYNEGIYMQNMKFQGGIIEPQFQHGKVANRSETYRIGYDAPTASGSSGSPVVNRKGQLVAVNNSGHSTQGFNFGIRTKYLKELLDQIKKKKQ